MAQTPRTISTLLIADLCRDGGSIAADFRLEGGELLSLLLEVAFRQEDDAPFFAHLHAGRDIQNHCNPSTVVAVGSTRDLEIQEILSAWRRGVAPELLTRYEDGTLRGLEPSDSEENSLHWALELCRNAPKRQSRASEA